MNKILTFLIATAFFIAATFSAFIQQYDYIIVGAGWAGLGACSKLKLGGATNILILEAKNRTGGRCTTFTYNGVEQDLGAAFIQQKEKGNAIDKIFNTSGYTKVQAWFGNETEWYVNQSKISSADRKLARTQYNSFYQYIKKTGWNTNTDQPLSKTLANYWLKTTPKSSFTKSKVDQIAQVWAIDNGAELDTMSTWEYEGGFDYAGSTDYTMKPSYSNFFQNIWNKNCSGVQTNLEETVKIVDYSGTLINVTTDKGSYLTKKLMISASIGILQASLQKWTNASTITFIPDLPTDKQRAINGVGFGRFEKLYVTFSSKFWDSNSSTLHFVCKTPPCSFTQAWVVPNVPNTILFWIAGKQATRIVPLPLDTIKTQLNDTLSQFLNPVPNITNIFMTSWWQDKNILGGFSYAKVNTTTNTFSSLRKVLKTSTTDSNNITINKNIWFIGQGTHPLYYSYSHGAFSSGVDAAVAALTA